MNFFLDNWMLMAIALSSAAMLAWPSLNRGGPGALSTDGAVQLINREKAVVVDVCETTEFANGHVAGSRNIPLGQLENKLTAVVKNKATPVIMVCYSGSRSNRAVSIAKRMGYEKAFSLSGGVNAWRSANLPIERA